MIMFERVIKQAKFVSHGRKPEVNISVAQKSCEPKLPIKNSRVNNSSTLILFRFIMEVQKFAFRLALLLTRSLIACVRRASGNAGNLKSVVQLSIYLTIRLRADSQRGAAELTIARRKRGRVV